MDEVVCISLSSANKEWISKFIVRGGSLCAHVFYPDSEQAVAL